MNSWPTPPGQPKYPLPPGIGLAGMRQRLTAWLIDGLILIGCQLAFWIVAVAVGAVSIDPAAAQQVQASPLVLPTVAPYRANLPLLAVLLVGFVVLNVVYVAVAWARFRGTPGQRVMSLGVASAATGRNLGIGRALIRAVVVVGVPVASLAGLIYGVLAFETSVPWSDVLNPQPGGPAEAWLSTWSDALFLAIILGVSWPTMLLLSTYLSRMRQGLHDALAGSLVVAQVAWPNWAAHGYGPAFGAAPYGPQAAPGAWPTGAPPGVPPGAWPPGVLPPATPSDAPAGEAGPAVSPWDSERETHPLIRTDESDLPPKVVAASVGRRVTAYLFDCALVYLIFGLTESIMAMAFLPSTTAVIDERTFILFGLVGGFEQLAYFAVGWVVWQGSLAQRLMHLRVADATTGKSMGWLDAVVRWAVLQGPFAMVAIAPEAARIVVLLGATSWAIFLLYSTINGSELRGLHDRFLNSRVTQDS